MVAQPFKLLYVCAGSAGRSALAAVSTASYVDAKGTPDEWVVEAATQGRDEPSRPELARAAEAAGLVLDADAVAEFEPGDVERYDLILAMSWDQAAQLWSAAPESWARSFTLKEFIHWAKQVAPRPAIIFPDRVARMRDRVDQAHAIRRRARADHGFWGGIRPQDLNVVEPEGKGDAAWRSFVHVVRTLTTDVVHLLGGP